MKCGCLSRLFCVFLPFIKNTHDFDIILRVLGVGLGFLCLYRHKHIICGLYRLPFQYFSFLYGVVAVKCLLNINPVRLQCGDTDAAEVVVLHR